MNPIDLRLYLVTDRDLLKNRDLFDVVEKAVQGGVTVVQLREKHASSREFYEVALRMKQLLSPYHVPLIINDRLDIVLAVDAEGLHIGNSDIPVEVARRVMGRNKILGLSVENESDARKAQSLDVDYIGLSPIFSTDTKRDTAPALGLEGATSIQRFNTLPSVAIGGINLTNVSAVMGTGVDGVAVVSAIICADDPCQAARSLREKLAR